MHRKSMFLCVFLILAFTITFIGCSFQSAGSSAGQSSVNKVPGKTSSSKETGTTKTEDDKPAAPGRETVYKC